MKSWDGHEDGTVFDFLLRAGCVAICVAILTMLVAACSDRGKDLLSSKSAVEGPYDLGSVSGTRNHTPHGGCDEKSGYTPTKPLERLSET